MRRGILLLAVSCLAFVLPSDDARGTADAGTVTTIPAPRRERIEAAHLADVNGDGSLDLVLSLSHRNREFERTIAVHLRTGGASAFGPEPDHRYELTPDVVAFAAADVAPGGGKEIVLFTATGAFAWRPGAPDSERPRRLVRAAFLWSLPHPREVFVWDAGVVDFDGDGLDDLCLPEPGGYRIALQDRSAKGVFFDRVSHLVLPHVADLSMAKGARRKRGRQRGQRIQRALGLGDRAALGDLVAVSESLPAPGFHDWDGDGDRDVLAHTASEFLVWLQDADGRFPEKPSRREVLPLDVDRGRRLDVSFGMHARQLDDDGRIDCVLLAGDRRSEEVRTQVMIYRRGSAEEGDDGGLFPADGLPDQALFVSGFAADPGLDDVNGDGSPDLVLATVYIDAIDALRAAASGSIDTQMSIYLGQNGRFPRRPTLSIGRSIDAKALRHAERLLARFFGDATGNGLRDLLVRDDPKRLRVYPTHRSRKGISVGDDPIFEVSVDEDAEVTVVSGAPGAGPELLSVTDEAVLHVRFR